ncbi:MAG: DNA polymerase III subunit beta [Candidatus Omnitrophica bacterium]|nr:DNA polymerase III subunit beta [Candidatus Omnitrophota bacterium]
MHFEIQKNDFLKGLQTVQNAIAQKNTLPILANLLLETDKNTIKIIATDLDIGISSRIAGSVKEEGAITVPAKKFLDIIKELPEEEPVTIILKKNNMMSIDCGKTHIKIIGLPKDEFPQIPEVKNKNQLTIPQKTLKTMLTMTIFAISRDETRYVLNGVLMSIHKKKIQIVATDGRRLAVASQQLPEGVTLEEKVIIPAKTVQELTHVLTDEGNVAIAYSDNQIFFTVGDTQIISRLIDGDYPNFEQVIPKEKEEKIKIPRDAFLSATRRAHLFTNPESLAVKLDVTKGRMIISKNAPYIGEVKEELTVGYSGKNMSIGFNPAYLIDVLKNLPDQDVWFEIDDADKPGVLRKGDEYIYVVLPMQVV